MSPNPAYFYTLELDPVAGAMLEDLAASTGHEDVEAFAAMVLANGLERLDRELRCEPPAPDDDFAGEEVPPF